MTITELVIAALATWEIIEIWRHGSIFADRRAYAQAEGYGHFLRRLLDCGFCLSPWVAFLLVLCPLTLSLAVDPPRHWLAGSVWAFFLLWRYAVYAFAVARLANLGNDLTHSWCRTPDTKKQIAAQFAGDDSKATLEERPHGPATDANGEDHV